MTERSTKHASFTIERTFARLRTQYGPGSPARALAPQTADAIWSYMEKCYESIRTPQARKAYRATACTSIRSSSEIWSLRRMKMPPGRSIGWASTPAAIRPMIWS